MSLAAYLATLRHSTGVEMRDLRLLAADVLGHDAGRLTLHLQDDVTDDQQARLQSAAARRALGEPVSKIIGQRQFWGRAFTVTADVLDPRGDTETLIEACLQMGPQGRVLDLGTGSGAIGLTLAAEWPKARVVCTDVSDTALAVAAKNAARLGVEARVTCKQSNWFEDVEGEFDLVASNPPYIALAEWDDLAGDVRDYDPRLALTDEGDGLGAYRVIVPGALSVLRSGGMLAVEIGWQQAQDVRAMFDDSGYDDVRVLHDLDGKDRCVFGRAP